MTVDTGGLEVGADVDAQSLQAWTEFLYQYANGQLPPGNSPPFIPASVNIDSPPPTEIELDIGSDFDKPVYDSIEITLSVARRARDFYARHSFLPPPRAPLENTRELCIHEYDLYSSRQISNIQSATDLIQAFFGGLCTFTLFRNNVQELFTVSGESEVIKATGLYAGKRLLPESSLCGHSVLTTSGSLYIPNLAKDWKYHGNPYVDDIKGIKSYYGSVVSLQVDPSSTTDSGQVAVGVINSMHLDDFLPPLNAQQEKVMTNIVRMLENQLQSTWEGQARTKEGKARRAISDIIERVLVQPLAPAYDPNHPVGSPSTSSTADSPSVEIKSSLIDEVYEDEDGLTKLELGARLAARRIRGVLQEIDVVGIIDLRSVHGIKDVRYVPRPEASFPTLAWQTSHDSIPTCSPSEDIIIPYLNRYQTNPNTTVFVRESGWYSGLEVYLPISCVTHVVMPFFTGDDPLFLIMIASSRPFYSFRAFEVNLIRSLGVVLRAQIIQSRTLEADAAKTAFLSSISHELRTPMHGVLSGMELIRSAFDAGDYAEAEKLLQMTESSGHTLEHILNDVLDFGSFTQGKGNKKGGKKDLVDLGVSALAAARTCSRGIALSEQGKVELLVELEDRDWRANIDQAGFERILFNGLTNALKFTKMGKVTLSLTTSPDNRSVICRVTDTGPGVKAQFLTKLFEPFTKANSFTPGAGLGLYITKALVSRLGGEITIANLPDPQRGAIFTVTLPVNLVGPRPDRPGMRRHIADNQVVRLEDGISKLVADTEKLLDLSLPSLPIEAPIPRSPKTKPVSSPEESKSQSELFRESLRVLVVDDNIIGRKILVSLLEQISKKDPIAVTQAVDGLEAIETFKSSKPHLVLTDVSMPRMDGVTAASEMRKIEKSQDNDNERKTRTCSAALDGWLIKGQDKLTKIKDIVEDVRQEIILASEEER